MDLVGEERTWVARAAAWLDASRGELVGLAVLLVGALLATGVLVWSALGRPDLTTASGSDLAGVAQVGRGVGEVDDGGHGGHGGGEVPPGPAPAATGRADGEDAAGPGGPGDEVAREVTVHVAGEVARPGLVTLPAGSRVADAVDAAGGATGRADLARTNLARALVDGEHVRVLAEGEEAPPPLDPPPSAAGSGDPAGAGGGRIDLNRASAQQLQTLPGIGPTLAERIVAHRETHGPFREPGDLREVSGIGERRFQDLADRVHVG